MLFRSISVVSYTSHESIGFFAAKYKLYILLVVLLPAITINDFGIELKQDISQKSFIDVMEWFWVDYGDKIQLRYYTHLHMVRLVDLKSRYAFYKSDFFFGIYVTAAYPFLNLSLPNDFPQLSLSIDIRK